MSIKKIYQEKMTEHKCCVLIPTYNNEQKIESMLKGVLEYTDRIIVVNDGSTDATEKILKPYPNIRLVSYPDNIGKGWALRRGFEEARKLGYQYAITIDSDGQHQADDIPVFLDAMEKHPGALVIGSRNMNQSTVPGANNFGHRFSNFWYKLETGISLPDTQSGFRLYPLKELERMRFYSTKYEFELEVLVRAAWGGIKVISVPINVIYPEDRITHFRLLRDFGRISVLHSLFVLWAFFYVKPVQFFSNFKKENRKAFIQKNILLSNEPNSKVVVAIMLGVFLGVAPIWGFQIITGIALAHLFRLSKVLVVAASNISIPPVLPLIIYASVKIGGWLLGNHSWLNIETFSEGLIQYIAGSFALGFLLALCVGSLVYILLLFFRRKPVIAD